MLSINFFLSLKLRKKLKLNMEIIDILKEASKRVFHNVKDLAGTREAAGDYGRGAGGDISRNIDIVAEKTVLNYLKEISFECVVLGEECGRVELSSKPKGFVIMDAIDGSANAVRGVPFFCCSLAFATKDKISSITDGVVTDLTSGDMYWATKGKGSFLNGTKIHVQENEPVYRIIGINLSGASADQLKKLQPVLKSNNHTRHFGANALEMALFARGLIDVFIDIREKIRVQDIAAGYLLIKEAGGLVLDSKFQPLDANLSYDTRLSFIATANKKILEDIFFER
jgi:myo-inositol-1(or 4)-monophosphatase